MADLSPFDIHSPAYKSLLSEIKSRIGQSRLQVSWAANNLLIKLY